MSALSIKLKMATGDKDANGKDILKEKTFFATEVKGRMLRRAVEFSKFKDMGENDFSVEELDNMINYAVELFDGKFTLDDVYDGLDVADIVPTILKCIQNVIERFQSKMGNLPNA